MSATINYPVTGPQFDDTQFLTDQKLLQVEKAGGGGGGGGTVQVYENRAPAAPDDPTKGAVSYPTGGGVLSQWDVGSASWV